ncbi:MAG: metallophosphoesterase family protein [Pseudomonadota bacterium]
MASRDDAALWQPDEQHPLLIFGGPYSNLQATRAVQAFAQAQAIPVSNILCTGDVCAYGAHHAETAERIRDWGIMVVQGNCEAQLATGAADCGCGFAPGSACDLLSGQWYPRALAAIGRDLRAWMGRCPNRVHGVYHGWKLAACHGAPDAQNRFVFSSTSRATKVRWLCDLDADLMLAGHCGLPFTQRLGARYWCNGGVIGMPANDGTRDGWVLIIRPHDASTVAQTCEETGRRPLVVQLVRLPYDAQGAAEALRSADPRSPYAEALESGLWPNLDVLPTYERSLSGKPISPIQRIIA